MYHGSQRGWIEIIAGVMFGGKSEELLRRVRRATIARKRDHTHWIWQCSTSG